MVDRRGAERSGGKWSGEKWIGGERSGEEGSAAQGKANRGEGRGGGGKGTGRRREEGGRARVELHARLRCQVDGRPWPQFHLHVQLVARDQPSSVRAYSHDGSSCGDGWWGGEGEESSRRPVSHASQTSASPHAAGAQPAAAGARWGHGGSVRGTLS